MTRRAWYWVAGIALGLWLLWRYRKAAVRRPWTAPFADFPSATFATPHFSWAELFGGNRLDKEGCDPFCIGSPGGKIMEGIARWCEGLRATRGDLPFVANVHLDSLAQVAASDAARAQGAVGVTLTPLPGQSGAEFGKAIDAWLKQTQPADYSLDFGDPASAQFPLFIALPARMFNFMF